MSSARAKKLDLGCFVNIKIIRDHTKRKVYEQYETERYDDMPPREKKTQARAGGGGGTGTSDNWVFQEGGWGPGGVGRQASKQAANQDYIYHHRRQALRYIIRNTTLPPRVRATAQLQLTQMHCYTNPTQIRNRCILGGKGRGILRDFKLSRVSVFPLPPSPPGWWWSRVEME